MDENLLAALSRARDKLAQAEMEQKVMLDQVRNSEIYMRLDDSRAQLKDKISQLTDQIKAAALEEYHKTGEKKLPGVTIKLFTTFTLADAKAAKTYAMEKYQDAVAIDYDLLGKLAAKLYGTPFELLFYERGTRTEAQIASDLHKYLPATYEPEEG